MKFSVIKIEPVALRPEDAANMMGMSERTLRVCVKAGWVKPVIQGNRMTLFEPGDIRALWNRIKRDGLPKGAEDVN